jgi:hypothetical protein
LEDFLQSLRHEDRKMASGEGDTENGVLETDVGVGTGEYVDEDTEEGILAGDVCMGNVDADFDGDASQKLFICIFKEESHNKIQKIGALVAGYKSGGLTFDKLEELKEFTTALVEQWSRMETAWDEAMVQILAPNSWGIQNRYVNESLPGHHENFWMVAGTGTVG